MKFSELLWEVQEHFLNPDQSSSGVKGRPTTVRYKVIDSDRSFWVLPDEKSKRTGAVYHLLIDEDNEIEYRIEEYYPFPYSIMSEYLYIGDRYDMQTSSDDMNGVEFTRYELQ